jgi:hypothetical protein
MARLSCVLAALLLGAAAAQDSALRGVPVAVAVSPNGTTGAADKAWYTVDAEQGAWTCVCVCLCADVCVCVLVRAQASPPRTP